MLSITEEEIVEGLEYAHDVVLDALWHTEGAQELLKKCDELGNMRPIINSLLNHIFNQNTKDMIAHWGFSDTPARDSMYEDVIAKKDEVMAILKKYSV